MLQLRSAYTIILFAGAVAILPPTAEGLREFGTWCLRPGRLPFAWKSMQDASKKGDAKEVFARGQQILQLVPSWTDGHSAMVYNYVLTHDVSEDQAATAAAAEKRLLTGIQRLEDARQFADGREYDLLHTAAFLPSVACQQFPGLSERLMARPGQTGGAAAISDYYLGLAAQLYPTPAKKEQQLWHTPKLAAALLECDAAPAAFAVLDRAISQAPEIRDRELATEWGQRLQEVVARLRGDGDMDISKVFEDRRFEMLWPFLRD